MYSKHRVEALSDGVFAIAMTLLILDIKVPVGTEKGQLWTALVKDGHGWISFVVTFSIASVFWAFQHRVFDLVNDVSHRMLVPTFVFLGLISVLPFSTSLWGHHINDPTAHLIYFANQFAIAVALTAKLEMARLNGYVHAGHALEMMRFRLYGMCLVMLVLGAAVLFVPLERIWMVALTAGIIARLLRNRRDKSLRKQAIAGSD